MGSAFLFAGTAKSVAISISSGTLSKLNPAMAVADAAVKAIGAVNSAYGLYSEKEKTRNLRIQYEKEITVLDARIREELKRSEIEVELRNNEMIRNLNILKNELEISKKELEADIKERMKVFSVEIEREMLKAKSFKNMLECLARAISQCSEALESKPDFMDAEIEEELREVIMNYTQIIKMMI